MVLFSVAQRLRDALVAGDFLARLGGDEFAVLMRGLPCDDPLPQVHARVTSMLDCMRVPETVAGFRVDVRASIGIATPSQGPASVHDLMREADMALYAAKDAGRDTYAVYEPG